MGMLALVSGRIVWVLLLPRVALELARLGQADPGLWY